MYIQTDITKSYHLYTAKTCNKEITFRSQLS